MNLLILSATNKSLPSVAKQLFKTHRIVVADWAFPDIRYSRFIHKYIPITSPERNLSGCIQDLINLVEREEIHSILPITDVALEVLKASGNRFDILQCWNVNSDEAYSFAHNKAKLSMLASESGISSPDSILVSNLEELDSDFQHLTFPCILKPVSSAVRIGNSVYGFGVRVCQNLQQVQDFGREIILNTPFLLQKKVSGKGFGFNFFAVNGEIKACYVHERLSEYNGQSAYRRSHKAEDFPLYPNCLSLIRKIGWNGVGMLEFKVDGPMHHLMELNGRFYGSSEVAIAAGYNFPRFLSGDLEANSQPGTYKDAFVLNFREELFKGLDHCVRSKKPAEFLSLMERLTKSLTRSDHTVEDNVFTDTRFQLELYRKSIQSFFSKRSKSGPEVVVNNFIRPRGFLAGKHNLHLCFVCFGNICRSPFAEALARKRYPDNKFSSVGFYGQERRISPAFARKTAALFDVNLEMHRSSAFESVSGDIDFFVGFDEINLNHLIEKGIPSDKIVLLGTGVVSDPYQKTEIEFLDCYRKIEEGLVHLFEK